ncbi:MAG: zinc-finger-containing protein [Bacteroidota bacterium]
MIETLQINKELGKKHFPKGCEYCGRDVVFTSGEAISYDSASNNIYCCEAFLERENGIPICNTYVYAHSVSKNGSVKDTPIGRLSNNELRVLHRLANKLFYSLWKDKRINEIEDYVVGFYDEDDLETRYGRVLSCDDLNTRYTIQDLHNNEIVERFKSDVETVSLRAKAVAWLAVQLDTDYSGAIISWMDKETTIRTIQILNEVL